MSLIFLEGFVKPLIMGTATGIACAEFSGLGKGYDGFTPRYFGGLVSAILANVAYQAGGYLFSFVGSPTLGTTLQIIWGLIILGTLLLRVRVVLHTGLMEAALEKAARQGAAGATAELQFCAHCEMPLVENASFCNACGTAVSAQAQGGETQGRRSRVGATGPASGDGASGSSVVAGADGTDGPAPWLGSEDTGRSTPAPMRHRPDRYRPDLGADAELTPSVFGRQRCIRPAVRRSQRDRRSGLRRYAPRPPASGTDEEGRA